MQIHPIPKTHVFVIMTIKNIPKDEEITVKYEKNGYYHEDCLCETCTGTNTRDLSVLKRNTDEQKATNASGHVM
jgi:hypothetical protein